MNLEQIVRETVAKVVAEKKGKDLTRDGKIDSADYLKARDIAIKKAQGKEMDEARFKKGEDVGGKGFEFKDIAKKAAKQYGSKEAGQRVAGAILKKVLNKEGEDHEVAMAQSSLDAIIRSAMELKAKIGDQEIDIPAWIQDHITNSENYIEQASQGYHEYENGGEAGESEEMNEEYDFIKSAIESASGDKISYTEEDDYGRTIYWSSKNPNVNYFVGQGGEFEGKIYLYNGETGERYPIGDLKHYGDGQNHSADDDMHESKELDEDKMDKEELKQAQIEKAYDHLEKMKANTRLFSKEDIKKAEERIEKLEAELDALSESQKVNEANEKYYAIFDVYGKPVYYAITNSAQEMLSILNGHLKSMGYNPAYDMSDLEDDYSPYSGDLLNTVISDDFAYVTKKPEVFKKHFADYSNIVKYTGNQSQELDEWTIRRMQHYAGIK